MVACDQLGWYAMAFDNVDWESRNSALNGKPDMFKMWLFKQSSSFCATGKIWVDGFDPNTPRAQIVTRRMKTLRISCTVETLAASVSFDRKSTSLQPGGNSFIRIQLWRQFSRIIFYHTAQSGWIHWTYHRNSTALLSHKT